MYVCLLPASLRIGLRLRKEGNENGHKGEKGDERRSKAQAGLHCEDYADCSSTDGYQDGVALPGHWKEIEKQHR